MRLLRTLPWALGSLVLILPQQGHSEVLSAKQYRVDDQAHRVVEISVMVYGTPRMARKIAQLNRLKLSDRVALGTVLKLPARAKLKPLSGRAALLNYWRKIFDSREKVLAEKELESAPPVVQAVAEKQGTFRFEINEEVVETFQPVSAPVASAPVGNDPAAPAKPAPAPKPIFTEEEITLVQATKLFESKKYDRAVGAFQKTRKKSPEFVSAWLYELRCLKELQRKTELATTLSEFKEHHPRLMGIPALRVFEAESGSP